MTIATIKMFDYRAELDQIHNEVRVVELGGFESGVGCGALTTALRCG
jgi:hypothetical protein